MADILKLTNHTRALLRAPLRPATPVRAALLAELLPIIKKPVAAQKKRPVKKPAAPGPSAAANKTNGRTEQRAPEVHPPSAQPPRSMPPPPARFGASSYPQNGKPANNPIQQNRPVEKPKLDQPVDRKPASPPPAAPSSPLEKRSPTFTPPRSPLSNATDQRFPRPAAPDPRQEPVNREKPVEEKPAQEKSTPEKPAVTPPTPPVPPVNGKPAVNGNGSAKTGLPTTGSNGSAKNGHNEQNGNNHHSPLFGSGALPGVRFEHPIQRNTPRPSNPISQPPLETPKPPTNGNGHQNGALNGNGKVNSPSQPAASNSAASAAAKPAAPTGKPAVRRIDLLAALDELFQSQPDLPAQAAVLGVGDDGFPVLLDLNDPNPGALVVIGDERQVQLDMLRSAVASIVKRNTARSVQILVVSCEPKVWQQWISAQSYDRYFIGVEGVEDLDALSEWVLRLGDWTEQRRLGERSGPPVILVMDTLSFMTRLDYNIRLNFEWMVKEGPPARIWPLAAISTDLALSLNSRRLLRSFHTRVLGFADDASFYQKLNGMAEQDAKDFGEPGVFAVQLGENWLRFRLPGR